MFIMGVKQWRSCNSSPEPLDWYSRPACMALWWIRARCRMAAKVEENRVHSHPHGLLGFLISCGRTLRHLHCSEHRGGGGGAGGRERTFSKRDSTSCSAEQWPATLFPISNSNAELILGEPHLSPTFFVSLSSRSLSSWPTSFAPLTPFSHSHPILLSRCFFNFRNALKPMPATRSATPPLCLPKDWTLGLFFFSSIYFSSLSSILNFSPHPPTWPCRSCFISFLTQSIVLAWKTGFWTGVK